MDRANIKWIFFDMGSTLIDESVAMEHRIREVIEGTDITYEQFVEKKVYFAKQNKPADLETLKFFGLTKTPWHKEDERLYPETAECLESLHACYKIGIIANQSLGSEERLKKFGIWKYIDILVASAEEGIAKPDRRIFEIALTRAGCKPEEAAKPQLLNQFPKELGGGVPCGSEGKCVGKDAEMPLQWDFSLYRPQVVIVAVGQNDAHPDNFCGEDYEGERAACWRKRYADFLRRLRRIHPQAHIICMTTILNHDENWDRAIEEACAGLGDSRVHHFLFSNNGRGTHGHIRRPEAEKMAEELSAYIEGLGENIWRETGRLENVFARAEGGEDITIGFLGGSITQGSLASRPDTCYASLVYRWWQERFPKGNFSYVNAGIGGTTSHFGVARADEDLLYARPDVVFVEFSVNDDDDAHFMECYEGLIRHILRCDWKPAVVLLHNRFYSDGHSAQGIHDEVGRYYGLPRVCMGDAVLPRIQSGELDREEITPDGLHPNDRGHELLAEIIRSELEKMYRDFRGRNCTEEKMPVPVTYNRYENTRRFRNDNICPVSCSGFTPDQTPQAVITETFRRGWTAEHAGDEICFGTDCRCIAVQYRRTVSGPAPKALAFVDGDMEHGVMLDGNFDEDWGDCLELQVLLEAQAPG